MVDIRQDALYINFLNYMKYNCLENEEEEVDEQVQKMCWLKEKTFQLWEAQHFSARSLVYSLLEGHAA